MKNILLTALLLSGFSCTAGAVSPTPGEMTAIREWVSVHLSKGSGAMLPFTFNYDGQLSSQCLPSWTATSEEKELEDHTLQRSLIFRDPKTGLEVTCALSRYADFPAVEWVVTFHNAGKEKTPILEQVKPLEVTSPKLEGSVHLHHSLGDSNSAESFAPKVDELIAGAMEPLTFAPGGGRSSDPYLPFFNIETPRGGVVVAVGWSGQWEATFQCDQEKRVHVTAGQQLTHLSLLPGETIRTPRILLVFWQGTDPLRGNNLLRQVLLAHIVPRRNGEIVFPPVCASVNETDPDGSYEGPHLRVLPIIARRGVETFWSDMDPQQWYPGGFPSGTGTWEPDLAKYPHGLAPIGKGAHGAGLEYLLWFEPERVAPGTQIAKEHPEWVTGGAEGGLFKLHDPEARKWLLETIDRQITLAQLDWVRWDFNIEPLKYWKECDAPDRQGITEIRHIEGLYAMWDDLRAHHPGLVIDNCASGGRRIDLETCTRGLPLWHSDLQCTGPHPAADQLQNAGLFRWIPLHGCGNFALEPAYAFRSALTGGNILAPSNAAGHLSTADPDTEEAVRNSVAISKKIRPYLIGDFYPLFPHLADEEAWFGYQFHRPDMDAGVVLAFRREKSGDLKKNIEIKGIDPTKDYNVFMEGGRKDRTENGSLLSSLAVEISSAPGAALVFYEASVK